MLVAVSPHCDDAVFGCSAALWARPGSAVLTVFAGSPKARPRATPWDRVCGFAAGEDIARRRRNEDARALTHLRARPVWLSFVDRRHAHPPSAEAVARALENALGSLPVEQVAVPLGLEHAHHRLTHAAALIVRRRRPDLRWLLYEDALYRRTPGLTRARLSELKRAGLRATRCRPGEEPGAGAAKDRAVRCYRSQLKGLRAIGADLPDLAAPERYWTLRP